MSDGQFIHECFPGTKELAFEFHRRQKRGAIRTPDLGLFVVGMILLLFVKSKNYNLRQEQRNGLLALLVLVFLQFGLSIYAVYAVPVWLGLTHQVMAFFLLTAMTFTLHRLSK
jgi:cytochrome c oxidase assembly protein subunit 15